MLELAQSHRVLAVRRTLRLEYFQPVVEDGRVRVKPPQGLTAEGCSIWENTKESGVFCRPKISSPYAYGTFYCSKAVGQVGAYGSFVIR